MIMTMKRNYITKLAALTALMTLAFATACVDDINNEYQINEKVVKLIPYSVKAQSGVDSTKAAVNRDNDQYFESGDKLVITGTDIEGTLELEDGGGESTAIFSGTLEWSGSATVPDPGLVLNARLVSKRDAIGEGTFIGGITNTSVEAVQKYSTLTATGTFGEKIFSLAQGTAFVECKITFEHAPADGSYPIVVTNNNKAVQIAEGSVNIRSGVSKFVICYPEGTVLNKALITLNGWDFKFGGLSTTLDGGKFYSVTKTADDLHTPFTMEAVTDGVIKLNNPTNQTLSFSINKGDKVPHSENPIIIPVDAGDVIQLFGDQPQLGGRMDDGRVSGTYFSCTGEYLTYGNVMSILYQNDFAERTAIEGTLTYALLFYNNPCIKNHPDREIVLPATTLTPACYALMFGGTGLTRGSVLPATTLTEYCYFGLYVGCTDFVDAPVLHATAVPEGSYASMFNGCTSLTKVPELPAMILGTDCYMSMFRDCTGLTEVPANLLPATSLAPGCYEAMFSGCTNLTATPTLPAQRLVSNCYYLMFRGCTSLNYVKCLATNISASGSTYNWLKDVAPTGTFVKAIGMNDWAINSPDGIPEGWISTIDIGNAFTLEAVKDGSINVDIWGTFDYLAYVKGDVVTRITSSVTIPVEAGDIVQFIGDNDYLENLRMRCNNDCYIYGNIMSLIQSNDFDSLKEIPEHVSFQGMFNKERGRHLLNHPEKDILLPATTLSPSCYEDMFEECPLLTRAPELPATTLTERCYAWMFSGCEGITTAPELPATIMKTECYKGMFSGTGLTAAPELPAMTLAESCYEEMFEECEHLTAAPALPATTLAPGCYAGMFAYCSITEMPSITATVLEEGCFAYMLAGTAITQAPELPWTTLAPWCYCGLLAETAITQAPELPATIMAEGCYSEMFCACENLTAAPELPATTLADECYDYMFSECTSLTTAPELPATTLAEECYAYMFECCTSLTAAPELPATTLANRCYSRMFSECTAMTVFPELPATIMADGCYRYMFAKTGLTTPLVISATTLAPNCFEGLYSGTQITTAPALPYTTLAEYCYFNMFENCTALAAAPALPATTLANGCYHGMFSGCTSLTSAPVLPATTLAEYCYQNMFYNCSNLNAVTCLANVPEEEWGDKRWWLSDWLYGTASTGTLYKAAAASWPSEYGLIPSGWSVQDAE